MYYFADGGKVILPPLFRGKTARYDAEVIKTLLSGPMYPMDIAKALAEKSGFPGHPKTVYSIIARKPGSLSRLTKAEFVSRKENGSFELTPKGVLVAMVLTGQTSLPEKFRNELAKAVEEFADEDFPSQIAACFKDIMKFFTDPEFWQTILANARELCNTPEAYNMPSDMFALTVMRQAFSQFYSKIFSREWDKRMRKLFKYFAKQL